MHAHISRHTTDDQISHALNPQEELEVSMSKGSIARLIDHRLAAARIELADDIVARLATNEQSAQRSPVADSYA